MPGITSELLTRIISSPVHGGAEMQRETWSEIWGAVSIKIALAICAKLKSTLSQEINGSLSLCPYLSDAD